VHEVTGWDAARTLIARRNWPRTLTVATGGADRPGLGAGVALGGETSLAGVETGGCGSAVKSRGYRVASWIN